MTNRRRNEIDDNGLVYNTVKSLAEELHRRVEEAKKLGALEQHKNRRQEFKIDADFSEEQDNSPYQEEQDFFNNERDIYGRSERPTGVIEVTDEDVGIYKRNPERGISGRKIFAFIIVISFILLVMFNK